MYNIPILTRRYIVSALLSCLAASVVAATVRGRVVDSHHEALEFVNLSLLDASGKLVAGSIVDQTGRFELTRVPVGQYTLRLSYVGYQTLEQKIVLTQKQANETIALGTLRLQDDSEVLQEVAVVGQKGAMRLEIDKKVFDIASQAAAAGLSASEALENIPSVEVDGEGTISLRGSSSVTIWINGKSQGLTSDNQADILEQMPAESIDHIEVITNPSSKYSPEGSAGIINIVLKRDRKAGYYGGVQANLNNDKGGRLGANINYSSGKMEAYASLGYGRRIHKNGSHTTRTYIDDAHQPFADLYTTSEGKRVGNNFFGRAGATWHFTPSDDLGLNFMGMLGNNENNTHYDYRYRHYTAADRSYDRTRDAHSEGDNGMAHVGLDYRHVWSSDHTLDIKTGLNYWRSPSDTWYNQLTTPTTSAAASYADVQSQASTIKNRGIELQADYARPVGKTMKLEAGYKGEFRREDSPTETWSDLARTQDILSLYNRFIYNIDIQAAYLNYGGKLFGGRLGYQFGLRNEYWQVHTESTNYYEAHPDYCRQSSDPNLLPVAPANRYFNKVFPTAFVSWQIDKADELQVNYTRRMQRPGGNRLNSFQNITDSTSISYGNPLLTPSYTHSFELNYLRTWKQHTLSVSAYYRPTSDVEQKITYIEGMVRYSTRVNIAEELTSGLEIVAKNRFADWVNLSSTLNVYYDKLDGGDFLTQIGSKEYHISLEGNEDFTWNIREQLQLMLPAKISFNVTANYDAPRHISQGHRHSLFYLDASLKRTFCKGKFTVALNGRNVFNTRKWHNVTDSFTPATGGYHQDSETYRMKRRFILQFSYSFGNMNGKKKNGQQSSDPDEQTVSTPDD